MITTMACIDNHIAAGLSAHSNCAKAPNRGGASHDGSDMPGEKDACISAGIAADDLVEGESTGFSGKGDVDVQSDSPTEHLNGENLDSECNGVIKEGYLYDIHHESLPPKTPIQLKAVRIVLVSEKTQLNVCVKFPSILSLRSYFAKCNSGQTSKDKGISHPRLDEEFVMSINVARRVLRRVVLPAEFQQMRCHESFWMLPGELVLGKTELPLLGPTRSSPRNISHRTPPMNEPVNGRFASEVCGVAAPKTGFLVTWGARRKVTYIGRHVGSTSEKSERAQTNVVDGAAVTKKRDLKRKDNGRPSGDRSPKKMARKEILGRWSSERYKAAQMKLVDIMHAKGAVLGKPILRPELREAARKHIGDTGLLDHLLKHMTDTVIDNGERFRRRHNSEGAMEYWLEGANLVHQRKEAGIQDPFWVPPPDWKPGDALPDVVTLPARQALELAHLKDEVAKIRRELDNLRSPESPSFGVIKEGQACSMSFSIGLRHVDDTRKQLLEGINCLLRKKTELEDHLVEVASSINRMKDDIKRILDEMESAKPDGRNKEESSNGSGESSGAADAAKTEGHMQRKVSRARSGFRLCKPQGTFLWPGMASEGSTARTTLSQSVQNFVEDILMSPRQHACPLLSSSSVTADADSPTVPSVAPLSPVKPRPRAAAAVVVPECAGEVDSRSARKPNLTVQVQRGSEALNHPPTCDGVTSSAVANCVPSPSPSPSPPSPWLGLATPSPSSSVAYP